MRKAIIIISSALSMILIGEIIGLSTNNASLANWIPMILTGLVMGSRGETFFKEPLTSKLIGLTSLSLMLAKLIQYIMLVKDYNIFAIVVLIIVYYVVIYISILYGRKFRNKKA